MEALRIERLDHFGLIACAIKDLGLIERLDSRLVPDEQEVITPGEAVAGMMLNGVGFTHRPLSLTPQFFAHKPLDLLLHDGVEAERFNRFTLGRTLDEVHAYGGDLLLSELALAVCTRASIDQRFHPLDTTSFSLSGDSVPASDAQAIPLTHGSAKDHRPDLQQAVLALLVSQDGGVPFVRKSGDGKASDTKMFQERAGALLATFQASPVPRSLVADAKLSTEDHATNLSKLGCITRIPGPLKLVTQVISQALQWDMWHRMAETTRSQRIEFCHYGMAQRGLVVSSQAALERAEASVNKACQRASATIDTQLLHLQATPYATPAAAQAALATLATSWRSHQVATSHLLEHKHSARKGRPTPTAPITSMDWHIQAQVCPDQKGIEERKQQGACFVRGSNRKANQLSDPEVMTAYKAQAQAEGGLRFLKDPLCFVSALFVKKPCRMQGLLMVMT